MEPKQIQPRSRFLLCFIYLHYLTCANLTAFFCPLHPWTQREVNTFLLFSLSPVISVTPITHVVPYSFSFTPYSQCSKWLLMSWNWLSLSFSFMRSQVLCEGHLLLSLSRHFNLHERKQIKARIEMLNSSLRSCTGFTFPFRCPIKSKGRSLHRLSRTFQNDINMCARERRIAVALFWRRSISHRFCVCDQPPPPGQPTGKSSSLLSFIHSSYAHESISGVRSLSCLCSSASASSSPRAVTLSFVFFFFFFNLLRMSSLTRLSPFSQGFCVCGEGQKHQDSEMSRVPLRHASQSHRHQPAWDLLQGKNLRTEDLPLILLNMPEDLVQGFVITSFC